MKSAFISNLYRKLLVLEKVIKKNIIIRLVWHLNYLQKPYKKYQIYNLLMSQKLIKALICFHLSPNLTTKDIYKIVKIFN